MVEPSPWEKAGPGRLVTASFVFVALLALVLVVVAVFAVLDGDLVGAVGSAAIAVYFITVVGLGTVLWWRPRRASALSGVVTEGGGLTFRYSRWAYFWAVGTLLLHLAALLLFGLFLLRDGDTTGQVIAIICFAGAVWFALAALRLLPGAPGHLRLTPAGLEHRGHGLLHRLPWESVADVGPTTINGSPVVVVLPSASAPVDVSFAWPTRIGGRRGFLLPSMVVRGMWLAGDPLTVYRTVRHYHANPEHRTELSTEAARQRVEQGRFVLPRR
ncbi:hypothetical protein [Actinoplanes sp. DH11]|uniref:hypothetical protein n=1 Tax=Actinoplanes sp. DH11 TaxID=2857011 RepID=UPI001E310E94|nr:hypothetical protein [Actinoplanes sp. DH11]